MAIKVRGGLQVLEEAVDEVMIVVVLLPGSADNDLDRLPSLEEPDDPAIVLVDNEADGLEIAQRLFEGGQLLGPNAEIHVIVTCDDAAVAQDAESGAVPQPEADAMPDENIVHLGERLL